MEHLTKNQLETIEEHENYHRNMLEYYSNIRKNGLISTEPKKPVSKLVNPKKKTNLSGEELHNYLCQHVLDEVVTTVERPKNFDFQSMKTNLQQLVKYLKSLNSHTLEFCYEFGNNLKGLKKLWEKEQAKGNIKTTWKKWVQKNLRISDREARRKREIAKILHDYPKLKFLDISCNEFYQRKKNIKTMVLANDEIGKFWKAAIEKEMES